MDPLKRLFWGQKPPIAEEGTSRSPSSALAGQLKEHLESAGMWDEAMEEGLVDRLEDKTLRESVQVLLETFLAFRDDPGDFEKFETLRLAGAQCYELMGDDELPAVTAVVDALSIYSQPVKYAVAQELRGEEVERPKSLPRNELEKYYFHEGFHQIPQSPSVWTNIEIDMPDADWESGNEGLFKLRFTLAFPGKKETSTLLSLPWNDTRYPELDGVTPQDMSAVLAMVLEGEEVEGSIGAVAADWVEEIKSRVDELARVSYAPEPVPSDTVQDTSLQRIEALRGYNTQALDHFVSFAKKHEGVLPMTELDIVIISAFYERIENEESLENLIFYRSLLGVVLPTAGNIRASLVDGFPVTYNDPMVVSTIADVHQLLDLLAGQDDSMTALIWNFTSRLVTNVTLHPTAKVAFDAGMDLKDVMKYSAQLQNRESAIGELMKAVVAAKKEVPTVTDFNAFASEQLVKIQDLRRRVAVEEGIQSKEMKGLLGKVENIVTEMSEDVFARTDYETRYPEFSRIVPLTTEQFQLLLRVMNRYPQIREGVEDAMKQYLEAHDIIRASLLETGRLPDNYYELDDRILRLSDAIPLLIVDVLYPPKNVGFTGQYNLSEEIVSDLEQLQIKWSKIFSNKVVFNNVQFFTDIGHANGLNLEAYRGRYGEPTGRLKIMTVGQHGDSLSGEIVSQIGYYRVEDSSNPEHWNLTKAEWEPEVLSDGEDFYFIRGKCRIGRSTYNSITNKFGPIQETTVDLDLTSLPFPNSSEKVEAYFKEFTRQCGTSPGCMEKNLREELTNTKTKEGVVVFKEKEIEPIIEHIIEFSNRAMDAAYKVHFAVLHPEDEIEGVITRDPPE